MRMTLMQERRNGQSGKEVRARDGEEERSLRLFIWKPGIINPTASLFSTSVSLFLFLR